MSKVQTRRCETTTDPHYGRDGKLKGWPRCVRAYRHRGECVPEFYEKSQAELVYVTRAALALEEQLAILHRDKTDLERAQREAEEKALR